MSPGAADSGGEAVRLDELAEVTREYGAYSRTTHGMALIAVGLTFLAIAVGDATFRIQEVRFAYLTVPLVWLVALWASRRRYQRHGAVVPEERRFSPRVRRWLLGVITAEAGMWASLLVWWSASAAVRTGTADIALWPGAAAFAVCLVPVLAASVTTGRADLATTAAITVIPWGLVGVEIPPFPPSRAELFVHWGMVGLLSLMAVTGVADGVRQHRRYRALERRLAALRSPAP